MTDPRTTVPDFPAGTILGYPRIGRRRELKRALEAHWSGAIDAEALERTAAELRRATRRRLAELGLGGADSSIPEAFSFYDQVHDAATAVGVLPARFDGFRESDGRIGLDAYFAAARGAGEDAPLEMTKWFDTNYHYLVPEIGPETVFALSHDRFSRQVAEATADGHVVRPVIVGPVTLLALSKPATGARSDFDPLERLDDLLPVYAELLRALRAAGADWVQLDEPALVSESLPASTDRLAQAASRAYAALGDAAGRPAILVAAGYGQLSEQAWRALAASPVEAIAIDLVRGAIPAAVDGLAGKTVVGGVVDGRNIWRGDLEAAWETLEALSGLGAGSVAAGTSTSLQHVPHDVADETELDPRLASWLAFADQKVAQVATLATGLTSGRDAIEDALAAASRALADRRSAPGVRDGAVRSRLAELGPDDFHRGAYEDRVSAQERRLDLPLLPTTTIGSFPQTGEIRRARARRARGELSAAEYETFLREEITRVVALQDELGLDVLVHGEPERNDMVQYFAEHLDGFAVTQNGWVQSYGSRATRPSILWGDVSRPAPITVAWSAFAQSLTDKPLKGMLTGPVTILAWSFVRDDQPLGETANQVALALRDEIADLEAAGIGVIQVDEPALRELLPLRRAQQPAYLEWSVGSFRLATAGAGAQTQVHTHLCYSEFDAVIDAIAALDADVTSIEAARSRGEVVDDIAASGFGAGIGPGVYDIHSPRVPSVREIEDLLQRAVDALPLRRVWVNPDCGLKTRGYDETVASLANLVTATQRVRARIGAGVPAGISA
ncbi:5-methyltetrahydropteroyltriglutamate--homocysteine S-methyltransferase [Microbacterium timonense]|uniref:5-methyltetrahydropteroyltriglutamate-- homocysteine S-methyltransferase n=1 Tax=Microbacterium timonense TaxID=2086576 RepID=UPI000D0F6212|nr:5-methyltetrahydropteroyltriglutamate--homocysteine S-methyltransferase [Microbacterium timonense]